MGTTGSLRFGSLWLQMTETWNRWNKQGVLQAPETEKIHLQVQPDRPESPGPGSSPNLASCSEHSSDSMFNFPSPQKERASFPPNTLNKFEGPLSSAHKPVY